MQSSSHMDCCAYDFNEDDEGVESASRSHLMKFRISENAGSVDSPHNKLAFMEIFNKEGNVQQTEINNVSCIDFEGNDGDKKFNDCGSYAVGSSERDALQEETPGSGLDDIVVSTSTNNDEHVNTRKNNFHTVNLIPGFLRMDSFDMGRFNLGALSLRNKQSDCGPLELPFDEKVTDVISDEDGSMETSSIPPSASDIAENEGAIEHPTSDHCSSGYGHMEKEIDLEVTVSPDFVLYGDRLFTHSRLTFASDCINFEDLYAFGSNESFNLKWEIDDIIHIDSHWSQTIETCLVTLRLRPIDVLGVDNVCSTPGIKELTFAVSDPHWHEKEHTITSLASRIKDRRNTILDGLKEEDDFMGQHNMFFPKRYFTIFDEPFEDVVYPKGDPDAISISKREIELLQPETYINDTLIDFYIKYLKNRIQPEDKHRFHFFNSFFFRKLVDLDKDPRSALEVKAAFQRVRKWTRKVNIFEKDYIFIPVNYNLHWSLIVICHPGEVVYFGDERVDKAHKVPCILHMDSIKGTHKGFKNLVQSYLCEEWKARHEESSEDASLKFSNLRFVPLELPQQENSFDCGLFLLHYVELFLEGAPVNFSPFKITKLCNFLSMDWFPPAEASHKRFTIQKLMYELIDDQLLKIPPSACNDQCHFLEEDDTENQNAVELLSEQCSPAKKPCPGNSFSPIDRGIERTLLPPSPGVQYDKETGSVLPDFLEQGAIEGSSSDENNQIASFKKHGISLLTIEEKAETGEHSYSPSDKSDHQAPAGILAEPCTTSCSAKDAGVLEMSCSQEIFIQPKEHPDRDPSYESSSCEHPNSSDVAGNDHVLPLQNREFVERIEQEEIDKQRSGSPEICENVPDSPASASTERLEDIVVEDSQEGDCQEVNAMAESKEIGDSFFSCKENLRASSHQDVELTEIDNSLGNGVQLSRTDLEDNSEQQVHKRRKLEPLEGARRLTRSVARDSHS